MIALVVDGDKHMTLARIARPSGCASRNSRWLDFPAFWRSGSNDSRLAFHVQSAVAEEGRGQHLAGSRRSSSGELTITRSLVALCLAMAGVVLSTNSARAGVLDASWTAPTTNTDGSRLTDLASYRVYYAASPASPCPGPTFREVASSTATPGGETVSVRLRGLRTAASYNVAVTAVDSGGNESGCSLIASASAQVALAISPTATVNFGSVNFGSVADQVFTVQNTRPNPVNGTAFVGAPFSIVSGSPFTLDPGATQNVTVRFTPTTSASASANVSFIAAGDTVSRLVTGAGVETTFALAVSKAGAGAGTVTTSPAGILCGVRCSAAFARGTAVTLTATPATGSSFTGWSGGGCSGTDTCTVMMIAARSVTATFAMPSFVLTVSKSGPGTGTVTSAPAGIACGATCSATFAGRTVVTLTTAPATGSRFSGWRGSGCSGTETCTVMMSEVRSVTAIFAVPTLPLSVSPATGGSGTEYTITLTNWTGAGWVTFARVGSGDASYGPWVYISSLPNAGGRRTWRVTPSAAGVYEARFYSDGFRRAATSSPFRVAF
jgi:Divergent InlB B-repeat domain/Abnormal spindle-like microcephaly-assoc'd, ASPM-SPD-2-Hydin